VPGRPALYATTKQFLDDLGLSALDELPALDNPSAQLEASLLAQHAIDFPGDNPVAAIGAALSPRLGSKDEAASLPDAPNAAVSTPSESLSDVDVDVDAGLNQASTVSAERKPDGEHGALVGVADPGTPDASASVATHDSAQPTPVEEPAATQPVDVKGEPFLRPEAGSDEPANDTNADAQTNAPVQFQPQHAVSATAPEPHEALADISRNQTHAGPGDVDNRHVAAPDADALTGDAAQHALPRAADESDGVDDNASAPDASNQFDAPSAPDESNEIDEFNAPDDQTARRA